MLPVGLQLYSVRNEMEKNFKGTLREVSEMGYDGVEFAGLFGKDPAEVRELLKKYSLVPVSAHVPLAEMTADTDKVINDYKTIGCKYIAVPYMEEQYRPGTPAFPDTIKTIKELGKKFREAGMTLLYHNHDFEFVKIDGKYGLDILYDSVPAGYLQTELDTCWVNVGGADPVEYIEKYSGRAPVVHLKDFVMKGKKKPEKLYALIGIDDNEEQTENDSFSFKPIGYGVQDMPAIIKASEKAGAEWLIVEQDEPDKGNTEFSASKKSIDYIRSLR